MSKSLSVGIIGAGLMGHRRADALKAVGGSRLVVASDVNKKTLGEFVEKYGCEAESDWQNLVQRKDIDVVIVAVPNKFIAPITVLALKNNKHILVEKPLGRNPADSKKIITAARTSRSVVKVGFNHRFHGAISRAKEIFDKGEIGRLIFVRARYGYGGRLGMEKEWRFQKDISGGGELLDQGVHVIDLARYFAGEFKKVYGAAESKFWKKGIDDNAFMILKNSQVTASMHVSATQWKNLFSFEVFGDKGFLDIYGKGGSYGRETLTFGKRKSKFGVPDIKIFSWDRDVSWENEWRNFLGAIGKKNKINGNLSDGLAANKIVEAVYKSSKLGREIKL